MICDYCQKEMEDTAALAVLYQLMGRDDGPKVDPVDFPLVVPHLQDLTVAADRVPRQEGALMYEVVYYVPNGRKHAPTGRWEFAARYDSREEADAKAHELRLAGYDARVLEEDA